MPMLAERECKEGYIRGEGYKRLWFWKFNALNKTGVRKGERRYRERERENIKNINKK